MKETIIKIRENVSKANIKATILSYRKLFADENKRPTSRAAHIVKWCFEFFIVKIYSP